MNRRKLWVAAALSVGVLFASSVAVEAQPPQQRPFPSALDRSLRPSCDCSRATLLGDKVVTQLGNNQNNSKSVVAGPAVELPKLDGQMNVNGSVPRWTIDFKPSSIRIEFVSGGPATYGTNYAFTFRDLHPQLGACPDRPVVVGVATATNNPAASWVASGTTFAAHEVKVPFGPPTGNHNWLPGQWIEVSLRFACPGGGTPPPSFDPCCPPWNPSVLEKQLFYEGSGSISSPYTLRFKPTATFLQQIQAYIDYLNALDPTIQSIVIHFIVHDAGSGVAPGAIGNKVSADHWVEWKAGGNGQPANGPISFFQLPAEALQVNRWYRVHTGIFLGDEKRFFPDKCANNDTHVRIQVHSGKRATGPTLEFHRGR